MINKPIMYTSLRCDPKTLQQTGDGNRSHALCLTSDPRLRFCVFLILGCVFCSALPAATSLPDGIAHVAVKSPLSSILGVPCITSISSPFVYYQQQWRVYTRRDSFRALLSIQGKPLDSFQDVWKHNEHIAIGKAATALLGKSRHDCRRIQRNAQIGRGIK